MTAPAPRTAAEQARDWLADLDFDARVSHVESGNHHAIAHAPHPLASDIMVRVTFIGGSREAAIAGARSQLRHLAERAFADPTMALLKVAEAREAHLYTGSVKSMARARRAVIARGQLEPSHNEIARAHMALKIDRGHEDHLVADVVTELLHARDRLATVRYSRPSHAAPQAALI